MANLMKIEQRGVKIGEQRGVKLGEQKGFREAIRQLLARGMDRAEAAQLLGLTRNKFENLLKD